MTKRSNVLAALPVIAAAVFAPMPFDIASAQTRQPALTQRGDYVDKIPPKIRTAFFEAIDHYDPETALNSVLPYIVSIPESDRIEYLRDVIAKIGPYGALQYAKKYIHLFPEEQRTTVLLDQAKIASFSPLLAAEGFADLLSEADRISVFTKAAHEGLIAPLRIQKYICHLFPSPKGYPSLNSPLMSSRGKH